MRRSYRYQRKKLFPLREAVILHLEPFSSYVNPYDMPEATCQEAISTLLSASRGNLSRVMNELKREGLLDDRRAHVPIGKLRRKTYILTEVGMKEARSLRMRARDKRIQLKDEAGKIFEVRLGDIPMGLRDGSSLLDIALSVHKGVFDKQAYIEKIKRESGFICLDDHKPTIRYFFGREEEQEQIMEWFESDMEKILEIKGVAGIGKTSLAVTVFNELKDRSNTIWLNLNEQSTLISVLEEIAAFLSLLGRKKLDTYLKSHPEMRSEDPLEPHGKMGTEDALKSLEEKRSEDILYIFGNECKDLEALFVVDGCEKTQNNLAQFLRFAIGKLCDCDRTKMILVGRTIPKLYDGQKFKRQGLLRRIVLRKLNYEDAKEILQLRGVEGWRQREAYKRTGGLPLFLDLMDPAHEFKTTDIERFLEEEVLSQLSPSEMRLMRVISIFGRPVHSDAFFQWRGVKHSTVRSLVEKSLLLEAAPMYYQTHDVLRDFIGKELKGRTRKSYHRKAAEFFLDQGNVESTVQGLSHLTDAGDVKRVVSVLREEGRHIIAKGHSRDLYQILLRLDIERKLPNESELAFLKGECENIRGSWDEAIIEYNRCLSLNDKEDNHTGVSISLRRIAEIQSWRGNHEASLKSLLDSAKISEEISDLEGLAECYYGIASLLTTKGDLQKAQIYVDKCLETAEISGNMTEIAKAHKVLGILKQELGESKESLRIKQRAVDYAKESGDLVLLSSCYNNIGVSFYDLEKNEEALEKLEKALEVARTTGDARATAYTLTNMASAYIVKPDLIKAEECLDESAEIFHSLREDKMVASNYLQYGFIYDMRGDWEKAQGCFKKSLDLMTKAGSATDLFDYNKIIGQLTLKKDRRRGLHYLRKASAIADGIKEVALRDRLRSAIQEALSEAANQSSR